MEFARDAWGLVKRSIQGWLDDSGGSMGAALAFYALFSMAPLTLVAIIIAGTVFGRDEAQHLLLSQLADVLGHRATAGIRFLVQATANHGRVFPVAVAAVTVLIGAATVFNELKTDLDRIWRCHANRPKGFIAVLRRRLISIVMVIGVGFLLLGSLLMSALISSVGEELFANLELIRLAEFGGSVVVVTGLFAIVYKALPSVRIAWGDVWVGAVVTSMLFWVGKALIAVYFAHNVVGSMYGAAGAIIVLIAWVYYSAQIFFLGAEFTRQYALRHGSHQAELETPVARNSAEDAMVDRARRVVKGEDPIVKRAA